MLVPVHYEPNVIISLNKEVKLNENDVTISRTDLNGKILFCNKTLVEISGFSQQELLKTSHNILRHPDMPKAIFYLVWQKILAGLTTKALVKNFTKEGDYYWVMLEFSAIRNPHYNIVSYIAHGTKPSNELIKKVEPLYRRLLAYEHRYGMYRSIIYLGEFLKKENIASYSDYLYKLNEKKKNSFWYCINLC